MKYPRIFWWLEWFAAGRRHCLICDDSEVRGVSHETCPTCDSFYCRQCWMEIKRICQVCLARSPHEGRNQQLMPQKEGKTRKEYDQVHILYEK